jgi:hypothetical protein
MVCCSSASDFVICIHAGFGDEFIYYKVLEGNIQSQGLGLTSTIFFLFSIFLLVFFIDFYFEIEETVYRRPFMTVLNKVIRQRNRIHS